MREAVRDAVLSCVKYALENSTQSGRHIVPLASAIVEDMIASGYDRDSIYTDKVNVTLPGWFRASKNWDIAAYEGGVLVAAIELKSISNSFGNNANNRAEEALGSAIDVDYATKNHLLEPNDLPPNYGYVLIIRKDAESTRVGKRVESARYAVDREFVTPVAERDGELRDHYASYVDRFIVLGKRLLRERIYQAVWVVVVDLEGGTVEEPDASMTYDKFVAHLKSWIDIMRA